MKSFILNSIRTFIIAALVLLGAGFLYAQQTAPPSPAPSGNPETFLDVSGDIQSRGGWLAVGSASAPLASLSAFGQSLAQSLRVTGSAIVSDTLTVGNTAANPGIPLNVGGDVLATSLAASVPGQGLRDVCADSAGTLIICPPPGAVTECSDGIDNDGDGQIDYIGSPAAPFGATPDSDCFSLSDNSESQMAIQLDPLDLISINPQQKTIGDPAFTMELIGVGFDQNTRAYMDGTMLPTTYVNPTKLRADIHSIFMATGPASLGVKVIRCRNCHPYAPGNLLTPLDAFSNTLIFDVVAPQPQPRTITYSRPGTGTQRIGGDVAHCPGCNDGRFVVPAGVTEIWVDLYGAGGGGGATRSASANDVAYGSAGGGGGGAHGWFHFDVTPGTVFPVYVGEAGGPGVPGQNPGSCTTSGNGPLDGQPVVGPNGTSTLSPLPNFTYCPADNRQGGPGLGSVFGIDSTSTSALVIELAYALNNIAAIDSNVAYATGGYGGQGTSNCNGANGGNGGFIFDHTFGTAGTLINGGSGGDGGSGGSCSGPSGGNNTTAVNNSNKTGGAMGSAYPSHGARGGRGGYNKQDYLDSLVLPTGGNHGYVEVRYNSL